MPKKPDEFLDSLVGELKPVQPLRRYTGLLTVATAVAAGCVLVALAFGLRTDILTGHPDGMLLVPGGLFLVIAIGSAWTCVAMIHPFVGARRNGWEWLALVAAILPVAALVSTVASVVAGESVTLDTEGVACLTRGLATGLLTAAALTYWLRRGSPTNPELAGLIVGFAAGAAGTLAVSLVCTHNDILHLGVWHGLTVAFAGLAGRFCIPTLIRW